MSQYSRVIVLGNLTNEPVVRFTPSQTPVVNFTVATGKEWVGQDGQKHKEVSFVDCTMFGKRAEVIGKFFHKGTPILIEGRFTTDNWTAEDGTKRSKLKVNCDNFEFVGTTAKPDENNATEEPY